MPREREAEYKPLSFSTTMRNPPELQVFSIVCCRLKGKY